LEGGAHLAPPVSKHPKQKPFTMTIITALHSVLNLSDPLDAAFYACLMTSFFSLACLGKVTVRSLAAFQPSIHVKVCDIGHSLKVTMPHLPRTKVSAQGEDIYFAVQPGDFDPLHALANQPMDKQPPSFGTSFQLASSRWPSSSDSFRISTCTRVCFDKSWNRAFERSWFEDWGYSGVPPPWFIFQNSQSHGEVGWGHLYRVL
jgi:hypothetical protein